MSENSTPEQRTEMPTEKRMTKLRQEGMLFMSHDLVLVLTFFTSFMMMTWLSGNFWSDFQEIFKHFFSLIGKREELTYHLLQREVFYILKMVLPPLAMLMGLVSTVGILAVMLQTDWNVREKKIKFDIQFLINPIAGVMKIISIRGLINTLKSFFKLALILPVGYFALKKFAPEMLSLIHMDLISVFTFTATGMYYIFWKVLYILIAFALFDYFYGKHQWLKQNKMTKEEVKDERKSVEGDEETKRKIHAKGLQRILQRIQMMAPTADVIVTNPTHFAVALKYDRSNMNAPIVVAKGADFLCERIKEIGRECGIPILERPPLARALYASTEVGSEIPYELFKAVAEIFAYLFKLKNPYAAQKKAQAGVR